jgi:toxin-antitoxin system PIN domain toxin
LDLILPDVNVLIYALQDDAPEHAAYRSWLDAVRRSQTLALAEPVLLGFVRLATNPRIYRAPVTAPEALAFVDALINAPRAIEIRPTESTWGRFATICTEDRRVRGNRVPDAWLAALAISHGARLATADRDFARYPGLEWFDPMRG